MEKCIFCKIISGEMPSVQIYENEHFISFLDINPTNPGHALVVPKKHCENLYDAPEDILGQVFIVAKKLAVAIKKSMAADGINLIQNNERAAGQLVPHIHLHIVPRFADDGFRHWHGKKYKDGEMEEVAKKIKVCI